MRQSIVSVVTVAEITDTSKATSRSVRARFVLWITLISAREQSLLIDVNPQLLKSPRQRLY
jgi:hypothetical protein